MTLFYNSHLSSGNGYLSEDESRHCVRVLRMTEGEYIYLTDGRGNLHKACITKADVRRCRVEVVATQRNYGKRDDYLHLAVALTKNSDRYEQLLETITEIGVDEITPLICEHSERRIVSQERLTKILIAAMKQSLKAYLPHLNAPIDFVKFIQYPFDGKKYIGCCHPSLPREVFWKVAPPRSRILLLIGPEGDFSKEEVWLAQRASFQAITLGNSRFRVETAGILACMANYMIQEKE
jgi:16S rRNA (uracil1498-N3)-methyltransferase